ncbi:transcriptional regulator [Bdellovibrio bacteriovorus]|uniref:Transcriptional regulator n=1 Tax=Bdellovibrio bacteriovorus TaxID=959 RepID=A0A150WQN2_BDEBC|nr:helix-turn-helix domain-containing protein [Bdellovibrio bacteriovorus]KYG66634.1 transcriptional regulator [Bdellovibrio bacteriovorus]
MKRTGEILKKAREEKGLSLHEIGLSLKISSKVLKAIEEGDESQLPAKTFLRGFVQSYSNYLHLDPNQVLEIFYQEMGSTRPKPYIRTSDNERPPSKEDIAAETPMETPLKPQVRSTPHDEANAESVVTPFRKKSSSSDRENLKSLGQPKSTRTILITILVVFLVGLIIFTKKMIDKYSKEAEVPTNEISQTMEGATPVDETQPPTEAVVSATEESKPEEATAPLTPISTKASPAPVTQASPSPSPSATIVASTPKPSPSPSATPTTTPSATPTSSPSPTASVSPSVSPSPAASATASPSPTTTPTPKEAKPVELIVEALDTVEIEYASPSGKPQKIKLSAEQVHTFKSRSGLKINFSNGGAVNLILNGKDIGIPGDLGKPIKLSY